MKNLICKSILFTLGLICVGKSNVLSIPSTTASTEQDSSTVESPRKGADLVYSIYEPYGLVFDEQNGYYTYNGSIVRYFNDSVEGASFTNFFTGVVDIEAVYDGNEQLIGITECSKEMYDFHTKKHHDMLNMLANTAEDETAVQSGISQNYEELLKDYETCGISYSQSDYRWYYNGEKIQIFIDSEKAFVYFTDEDGVCLTVSRNDHHEINEIQTISQSDAQLLMQSNNQSAALDSTIECHQE